MQYRLYEFFQGGSLLLPTSVIGRFTKFWKKRDIFGGFCHFGYLLDLSGSFFLTRKRTRALIWGKCYKSRTISCKTKGLKIRGCQ